MMVLSVIIFKQHIVMLCATLKHREFSLAMLYATNDDFDREETKSAPLAQRTVPDFNTTVPSSSKALARFIAFQVTTPTASSPTLLSVTSELYSGDSGLDSLVLVYDARV